MKKFILLLLVMISIPLYSQSVIVDKAKLDEIIRTEVAKIIDKAVNDAVAVAIKAEDEKYILMIADKDKEIVTLNGTIQKKDVHIKALDIQIANIQIKFDNYKLNHGLKRDLIVGGVSSLAGIVIGVIAESAIK